MAVDQHPAGGTVDSAALFFGTEVEGCYVGVPTAFIRCSLSDAEVDALLQREGGLAQVFLTETFWAWDWLEQVLLPRLSAHLIVTMARHASDVPDFFSRKVSSRLRLMVRYLDASWFQRLRPNDEITVGVPYNLVTFKVADGVVTRPEHYEGDTAP